LTADRDTAAALPRGAASQSGNHASRLIRAGRGYLVAVLPVIAVAVVFVLIWDLAVRWTEIEPILLPPPGQVLRAGWENRASLTEATWVTTLAATVGLLASVLVGVAASILFSQSRHIRNAFYPYAIFLQTVPIIAIAPLLITWTGYTFQTVVYVALIISLFPIISNVTAGLVAIDRNLADLFQIYHAGRWQVLIRLRIPTAIPYLILGMRISSGLAVIGAIVGDFFVGTGGESDGLGTLITSWGARQKTDAVIAAVVAATFVGIVFFAAVNLIGATVFRRFTTR
jgi:NitT/TauT family transport system permease protein